MWAPDQPVDGYGLWKPRPHDSSWSGCVCLSRRVDAGCWEPVVTDPDCRGINHGDDDWED